MRWGRWGAIFSKEETDRTGILARRLGGYEEMLRLERQLAEHERNGVTVRMIVDEQGRRQIVPA